MKKHILTALLLGFICIQMTGCGMTVRTATLRKPRTDQEISGNRGFISGEAKSAPKKPAFAERKVYQVEVELPQWKQKKTQDKVLWGNRGYVFGGPQEKEKPLPRKTPVAEIKEKISEILESKRTRTYKAEKGDTLQKISRKFYGTTKKWTLIYKANRDKLESPDRLYPGQVLVIPEVSEFKK